MDIFITIFIIQHSKSLPFPYHNSGFSSEVNIFVLVKIKNERFKKNAEQVHL